MARNCLRITHQSDTIQLSWQRGQSAPRVADAVTFEHPFDKEALTDLRWYLEEYLRFPYGIFPDNAKKVEDKLQEWGQQLFELVFRSSEKARQFFQAATFDGLDNCELVITSDEPTVLNLPWELLYSPDDRQFLAPSLAGMSRSLSEYAVRAEMQPLPQDKLNILLVIARPYGETDIELRTIARPLLQALQPIKQNVHLKVLRPPSFEEFERELSQNKGFYHIVHFDGHGDFDANSVGFQHSFGNKGQGVLVFESHDGSPQVVTAAQIAQNLADCGVPIFVLNACKSAQEGEDEFSSIATRLVSLGAKGVVAMAYSVYAEAAKHFMGRFYSELVEGKSISSAIAAGRKVILNHRLRPSPKGDLPLADWMVPVLYQQEPYKLTIQKSSAIDEIPDIDDFLEEPVSQLVGFPEEGAYGFIGRDYDILRLERAFRQNNIVLLQGMAGVGKTSLVRGFAEWLAETQGRAGKMFFISFETGASLSRVVNEVGREVWGDKFSNYSEQKQQAAVLKYLQTQPCLLIWDNFEPVNGFPEGDEDAGTRGQGDAGKELKNEPLLSLEEREQLKKFLKGLRGGKTWVLITSRREEVWLDCGYTLLNLGGLKQQDVEELAAKILQTVGVSRNTLALEYVELLKLLGGHPLSLRVVLPHLKTQTPAQVIEALRLGLDNLEKKTEEGRDKSLTASLDYSFSRLSEKARKHLPFLGFFCERVDTNTLDFFSKQIAEDILDFKQAYQSVFEENLQKSDWLKVLDEATEAGITEKLADDIYKLHPALPWYLHQQLSKHHTKQEVSELEKKLLIFYMLLATANDPEKNKNSEETTTRLLIEEPNLLQNLRLAEQQQDWYVALTILRALGQVYDRLGLWTEFRSLRQRAFSQVGTNLKAAKAQGKEAFEYWMVLRSFDAVEAFRKGNPETAMAIHQEILDDLIALNDSSMNYEIAVAYANLGVSAREKKDFQAAFKYFQQALKIYHDAGDSYQAASIYYDLGVSSQQQWDFPKAINYLQEALKIYQKAKDLYRQAGIYQQLGVIARRIQDYMNARINFEKAIQIVKEIEDYYMAASIYHELGQVEKEQGNWESAKLYFYKSLQIYEDAHDFYNASDEYQGLGVIAKAQSQLYDAEAYFNKALNIRREFQDWCKIAETLVEFGETLEAKGSIPEALKAYIEVFMIDVQYNQSAIGVQGWIIDDIHRLGRICKVLGKRKFKTVWRQVTGADCPEEVREAIWAARDRLG